jgi:hypothetical protein
VMNKILKVVAVAVIGALADALVDMLRDKD